MGSSDSKSKQKVESRILILGLDNSGKTTILKSLSNEQVENIMPTQGFNAKSIKLQGQQLVFFDVGGQKNIRNYWSNYFQGTRALVWVIDSADKRRLEEVSAELSLCMDEPKLVGVPLLVLANKQDLETAMKPNEICDQLGLWTIRERPFQIQACSALTGTGVKEGINWVISNLK